MMVPLGIKPIFPNPTGMVYAGPAGGLKPAAEGRTAAPIRFRRRAFNQPNAVGANRRGGLIAKGAGAAGHGRDSALRRASQGRRGSGRA